MHNNLIILLFAAWPAVSILFYGYSKINERWMAAISSLLFLPTLYWVAEAFTPDRIPLEVSNLLSILIVGAASTSFLIGAVDHWGEEEFEEVKYYLAAGWIFAMLAHAAVLNLRMVGH